MEHFLFIQSLSFSLFMMEFYNKKCIKNYSIIKPFMFLLSYYKKSCGLF